MSNDERRLKRLVRKIEKIMDGMLISTQLDVLAIVLDEIDTRWKLALDLAQRLVAAQEFMTEKERQKFSQSTQQALQQVVEMGNAFVDEEAKS